MNSTRIALTLGLTAGLVLGLFIVVLLFRVKVLDMRFDERQERARGVAFRYAFYTLTACVLILDCVDLAYHWCDALVSGILSVCIACTVLAVTAIRRDAYLGLYERPRRVMTLFAVIAAVNLVLGVSHVLDGSAVVDGVVTFWITNLLLGIMLTVVLAVYVLRCLRGQETEEDGE